MLIRCLAFMVITCFLQNNLHTQCQVVEVNCLQFGVLDPELTFISADMANFFNLNHSDITVNGTTYNKGSYTPGSLKVPFTGFPCFTLAQFYADYPCYDPCDGITSFQCSGNQITLGFAGNSQSGANQSNFFNLHKSFVINGITFNNPTQVGANLTVVYNGTGCVTEAQFNDDFCDPQITNDYNAGDPCACNISSGLADGTLEETVSVTTFSTGDSWIVTAISALSGGGTTPSGIAVNDALTETTPGVYDIGFNHSSLDGYSITVMRNGDSFQRTFTNVCGVPAITFNPTIAASYSPSDATITLGATIANGGVAATGSPTYSLDGSNNITQLDFDATSTDLTTGQVSTGSYTLTAHYETNGNGTGVGGTLVNPAVPTNACPVEKTAAFAVNAGLPVVSVVAVTPTVAEGDGNTLSYRFSRTGDNSSALTVSFSITAVNSADYSVIQPGAGMVNFSGGTGTIIFPTNAATVDLEITNTTTGDSLVEDDIEVVVTVEP